MATDNLREALITLINRCYGSQGLRAPTEDDLNEARQAVEDSFDDS